jgi:DNA-directed RNA polymerase specialized sigma24 family protein
MSLVQQAASDRKALSASCTRHVKRIYNYIYYRTGDYQGRG